MCVCVCVCVCTYCVFWTSLTLNIWKQNTSISSLVIDFRLFSISGLHRPKFLRLGPLPIRPSPACCHEGNYRPGGQAVCRPLFSVPHSPIATLYLTENSGMRLPLIEPSIHLIETSRSWRFLLRFTDNIRYSLLSDMKFSIPKVNGRMDARSNCSHHFS